MTKLEEDHYFDCGLTFVFDNGDDDLRDWKYCPKCGKQIKRDKP